MRKSGKKPAVFGRLKKYLVFWAFLAIAFSAAIFVQVRKQSGLSSDIASLERQIQEANDAQEVLQQQIDLKNSDNAIEAYGHSQGMVYPNEILIQNDGYQSGK